MCFRIPGEMGYLVGKKIIILKTTSIYLPTLHPEIFLMPKVLFRIFLFFFFLVLQVPFCDQMDDSLLDAMCERLKPALCTEGTVILREGDPVNEMFFVIRGQLESMTHNGGQSGQFNYAVLKVGDFCGDELLTWALDPKPQNHLPVSTHTVKALKEVEAFSLSADDLKFVASQFRKLHSRQLQHTFRWVP